MHVHYVKPSIAVAGWLQGACVWPATIHRDVPDTQDGATETDALQQMLGWTAFPGTWSVSAGPGHTLP